MLGYLGSSSSDEEINSAEDGSFELSSLKSETTVRSQAIADPKLETSSQKHPASQKAAKVEPFSKRQQTSEVINFSTGPSLIGLNVNVQSLSGVLQKYSETINQHADVLKSLSADTKRRVS